MDETELRAIVRAERAAALGVDSAGGTELSGQRADAMDFYKGEDNILGVVPEGQSRAVSTDVADTIDGIMPSLLDIFTSTDEIVKFDAVGPEDEDAANQETDYVNYVFHHENPGFRVLHAMIKDALIQKNGIVKYWWDDSEQEERETYRDLPDDAYALLTADENIEIIEHTERKQDDYARLLGLNVPQPEPLTVHDVTVIKRQPYGCVKVREVPPEEFLISRRARSIAESPYCAHKTKMSASELIAAGYPRAKIEALPSGTSVANSEEQARSTIGEDWEGQDNINRAMREIEVVEHYIKVDYDDDGIAELRKVTTAGTGDEILDNEPYDRQPFAGITPILMSHQFFGRSMADIVMDIQKIKTAIIRAVLNNAYFLNNTRTEVGEDGVTDNTLDDLLTNRPGGIVRTKRVGSIAPIPTMPIGQHLFPVLEYMDVVREVRTGVNRNAVGPDANSLNPYANTATGANILATAAQQRIRLIARTFAETGIKELFYGIHELILKHGTQARKVKLRNKWVTIDPRQWKTRKDMTVMVGLGTGTRDQIQAYLMQVLGLQIKAVEFQGGAGGPLVTLTNIYNSVKKLVENAGFRSAEPFFTEPPPEGSQPQEQRPDPKMAEVQGKLALKQAEIAGNQQMRQAKIAADAQARREENVMDLQLKREEMAMEAQLKRFEATMEAQVDMALGRLKAGLEAQVALMKPDQSVREGGRVG